MSESSFIQQLKNAVDLYHQNKFDAAQKICTHLLTLQPNHFDTTRLLANIQLEAKNLEAAATLYKKILSAYPNHGDSLLKYALTLHRLEQYQEAISFFDKALHVEPHLIDALFFKGHALHELQRYDEAMIAYKKILTIDQNHQDAIANIAYLYEKEKQLEKALDYHRQILALNPKQPRLRAKCLHIAMQICDWENYQQNTQELIHQIMHDDIVCDPFSLLSISSSIQLHQKVAKDFAFAQYPSTPNLTKFNTPSQHKKIRLGYFAAEFYNHATSFLIAELFEQHNADLFEVYLFSFGISVQDPMVARLNAAATKFIDVAAYTDEQIVELAHTLEIDIAIDLKGFTGHNRTNIFAMRAAPIQVNFLGYPGTMGAEYIDYIIADHTVIPPSQHQYYSEKIVYMPYSYQPNDSKRPLTQKIFTRTELGLPENAFVFCSFNNNHKINPPLFDCWMHILHATPGSVLWLLEDNQFAARNLHKEAEKRGIHADRIIFAKRMLLPQHLARHHHADLFLDTFPYNAHTTASDALWSGLPLLTYLGESFPERVAASLLFTIGLPELVALDLKEYEEIAIALANRPQAITALKNKLIEHRTSRPLFNASLFAKHIESAYQAMFNKSQQKLATSHITVHPDPSIAAQ